MADTPQGWTSMVTWDFNHQPSFSKALIEITTATLIMECSNAARIARLALISEAIGDKGMLTLVKGLSQKYTRFNLVNQLSWKFFEQGPNDVDIHIYAYLFTNIPDYFLYKEGPDNNHNIIKLANGRYIGFDPEFFQEGKTYEEFSTHLWKKMKDRSHVKSEMKKQHENFSTTLSYREFEEVRQNS